VRARESCTIRRRGRVEKEEEEQRMMRRRSSWGGRCGNGEGELEKGQPAHALHMDSLRMESVAGRRCPRRGGLNGQYIATAAAADR
jgi:hypothetical protein